MAVTAGSDQIEQWLRALVAPGSIAELRCPKSKLSGWYHRLEDLARDAYALSEAGEAVYWTINPVQDDLLERADHKYLPGQASNDRDITRRARLLIDIDPCRPADTSATDDEKSVAWDLTTRINAHLEAMGWPAPALVDSGNGYHSYYQIDLPADDGGLVARALKGLAAKFSTETVKVDTSVSNASRISKIPGTVAGKGDDTTDRPHRTSSLISAPDKWETVTREQLEAVAKYAPQAPAKPRGNMTGFWDQPAPKPVANREERVNRAREYLKSVPIAVDGSGGSTATLTAAGKIRKGFDLTDAETFEAMQDWNARCDGPWEPESLMRKVTESHVLGPADGHLLERDGDEVGSSLWTPKPETQATDAAQPVKRKLITFIDAADLVRECPEPLPAVLEGLLRQGELLGLISGSKVGKSWLCMSLALSILRGDQWMGRFQATQGKVLLIDTEVQRQTLSHRWQKVCKAHGASPEDYRGQMGIVPLREHPTDMEKLCRAILADVAQGQFRLIIIDSFYKLFGEKQDENSNACVGKMLSDLQAVASRLGIAVVVVHHTSKGNQGGKSVTDTGAGAGAFWRCIDSGLAIRQHEDDGVFVVDGVVRSFKPFDPFCARQDFPLWTLAEDHDPQALRQEKARQRAPATPKASDWTVAKFVECCPTMPTAWGAIEASMETRGCKAFRCRELRKQALDSGLLHDHGKGMYCVTSMGELGPVHAGLSGFTPTINLTSEQRKRAEVEECLRLNPTWSQRKVAEECGVSKTLVAKIKDKT